MLENNTTRKYVFIALVVAVIVSLGLNGFLWHSIGKLNAICETKRINEKVLEFRNMFTEKVLLAEGEVDFDTRLALETAVRGLNDKEIFSQWQKFTNSKDKENASLEAKKLLRMLVQKTTAQ